MPIPVTCPNPDCGKRFKVSEKFAGQTGPCPGCKQPIKIPMAAPEVKIHSPEFDGPKDATGRSVLKPLEREETEASPVNIVLISAVCVVTVVLAFIVGRMYDPESMPLWLLGFGAFILGAPLSAAGYALLRDNELAPHAPLSLWLRAFICGTVYALLWGAFWYVKWQLFEGELEMFHMAFILPALAAAGGVAGMAAMELDYTSGVMHCGIYILVTCMLRYVMGLGVY